jgi:hypothetical protein
VLEILHSAKNLALGIRGFSGSASYNMGAILLLIYSLYVLVETEQQKKSE